MQTLSLNREATTTRCPRERKIPIDYLRNSRTNTSICADSPRATGGSDRLHAARSAGSFRRIVRSGANAL